MSVPTDEQIAKILYWVMLVSPTPKEVRAAFDVEFTRNHWSNASGRTASCDPAPDLPCLVWHHTPDYKNGLDRIGASEKAAWCVTELGIAWLKAYEERQNDTE